MVTLDGVKADTNLRGFRVMRQRLMETYTSFAFRKHSAINEPLTRAISMFLDRGIFQYWKQRFDNHKVVRKYLLAETDLRVFRKPEKLTFWKLYPIFLILLLGHALACLVFFVELFYHS